ncbi:hypothetical protein CWRG_00051 [Chthonomonas calidirosea]|uniref:Prokaryotic membrane lipoprotein lipid attachment site n=1 Tax=Chthonomonas calidirosea (strain DSM 23976 / ICMP 18418 / T49) TaxID=1303518 RepID=S0EYH9_CHTCT|nr:hypothetical protein [Chthonomonas calidirosea]CCW34927.1 hypothetical protein CCALI_01105 [Chthonomonas calidirosea T49]CEK12486.1 hypothetical protein CWRG_00051 [Chthonomonas calidirosea]CEK12487.1 hypothetical protein CP488_00051 [Chthonomonas calidirosea]CEK13392.1 hypothetical protein CTKA_00053 [Chthonomonas calidirosea]
MQLERRETNRFVQKWRLGLFPLLLLLVSGCSHNPTLTAAPPPSPEAVKPPAVQHTYPHMKPPPLTGKGGAGGGINY